MSRPSFLEHMLEFTRNYFLKPAEPTNLPNAPAGSDHQQAAHKTLEPASLGEPQPVCRLLDSSADIAEEYARPQKVSERQISGQGDSTGQRSSAAPRNPFTLSNLLGLHCQQMLESEIATAICNESPIGFCDLCGLVICSECGSYAVCEKARNSVHRVARVQ